MAIMAGQTTGCANPSIPNWCACQAREYGLPLQITFVVFAFFPLFTTLDQICFLLQHLIHKVNMGQR